jgi:monoamine oxidase
MGKVIGVIVAVVVVALIGFTWFTLSFVYSSGERSGFVQKFSRRGWVCKTWEGEMALVTLPGTVAEKFEFTVRDDAVARQISTDMTTGNRITLQYNQHKWIPNSCFGDTEYFVTAARLSDVPAAPASSNPPR